MIHVNMHIDPRLIRSSCVNYCYYYQSLNTIIHLTAIPENDTKFLTSSHKVEISFYPINLI